MKTFDPWYADNELKRLIKNLESSRGFYDKFIDALSEYSDYLRSISYDEGRIDKELEISESNSLDNSPSNY